jgi:hypothetical protein
MTTNALATAQTWPSAVRPVVSAGHYPEAARRPAGRAAPPGSHDDQRAGRVTGVQLTGCHCRVPCGRLATHG